MDQMALYFLIIQHKCGKGGSYCKEKLIRAFISTKYSVQTLLQAVIIILRSKVKNISSLHFAHHLIKSRYCRSRQYLRRRCKVDNCMTYNNWQRISVLVIMPAKNYCQRQE